MQLVSAVTTIAMKDHLSAWLGTILDSAYEFMHVVSTNSGCNDIPTCIQHMYEYLEVG